MPDSTDSTSPSNGRPSPEQPTRQLRSVVVRGIGFAGGGIVLSRALTFAAYLVLARLAAPSVFGRYAAGSALVGIGGVFVESGLVAALIQRPDRTEEAASTAFAAIALGGLVLSAAAAAVSPVVGIVFDSHTVELIALGVSGLLAVGAFKAIPDAMMQRQFSFLRRVVVDPLGVVAFGTASIIGVAEGLGPWGLVIGAYASELVQAGSGWLLSGYRPDLRLASVGMWRELARYGRFILAGNVVDHVAIVVNAVLLGRFVSPTALGEYRYARRFGVLPHDLVVNTASYVLMPAYARIASERERMAAAFRRSLRWMFTLVLPLSMLFLPLGTPLVVVLLGQRWRPAGVALMTFCALGASRAAGSVAAAALKGAGRPQPLPWLHLANAVLGIGLMIALLPFGLTGVAAGVAAGTALAEGATIAVASRVIRVGSRAIGADLGPPVLAAGVMVTVLFAVDRLAIHSGQHATAEGLALLLLESLLGAAVYACSLLAVSARLRSDLARALELLRARGRSGLRPSPEETGVAG